jgi:hypothetical protein
MQVRLNLNAQPRKYSQRLFKQVVIRFSTSRPVVATDILLRRRGRGFDLTRRRKGPLDCRSQQAPL